MTDKTHMRYGDPQAMVEQAVGLFATHTQRNTTLNRLTGKMPKGTAGAEATLRKQTTQHMPIVRCQDLGKGRGDEVTFHLLNPTGGYPIMGSEYAEGRGVGMKTTEDKLRVNQARFPIDLGDTMTTIRSPADFRRLGRPVAQARMDAYVDQSLLVHMAGARGFHDNIEWAVPTEQHAKFAEIMVNRVKAPTKNRHFIADGGNGIKPFTVNAGEVDLSTTDLMKMDTVDGVRTFIDQVALPPPPVIFEGDAAANDSPLRVMLVSAAQYNLFAADPNFRQLQASAMARAQQAKGHPLFLGEVGLWNGVLIVKMPKTIRFYAGDTIRYCAASNSEAESTCVVPAGFGTTHAIDRAILLGGQAVAEAMAASEKSKIPFFWSEKELDHGDKVELLLGAIRGVSKIRFAIETGNGTEFTDYGATAIDTAVPIIGARK
ncbi:MAG TPA: N4-gp56 family major capsid protein [Pseudomonas sp.]|nr:N4-gp56 family major capsid protein [Pseudomonas sp.]